MDLSIISTKEVLGNIMLYLIAFWIILILFILTYYISKFFKISELKNFLDKEGGVLFLVILTPLIFMVIATKDPIAFGNFQIPVELQWLGSLFAAFFGAWKFYLNPLKDKVISLENRFGQWVMKCDTEFKHLDKGIEEIKSKLK
jgi:hypothetical protein